MNDDNMLAKDYENLLSWVGAYGFYLTNVKGWLVRNTVLEIQPPDAIEFNYLLLHLQKATFEI